MTNIEQTYSASGAGNYFSKIKGNYNGVIKFSSGITTKTYYLANIPSLLYNDINPNLLNTGTYYIVNNGTNLPYQIDSSTTTNNKTADLVIKDTTNKSTATLTGVDITAIVNATGSDSRTSLINSTFSGATLDSFGGDVGVVTASVSNGITTITPTTIIPSVDSNTVLLLHFDGNLNNSGVYTGTITNNGITYNTGKFGQSAYFNGSSHLALSDSSDFTWNSDFTIDFWVKFTDVTKTQTIFSTANDGAGFFRLFWYGTSSVWEVTDTSAYQDSSDTLQNNQWYHVVVERYNNNIKIFRDGNQVNTNRNKTTTFDPDSNGFRLGSNWSTPGTFFNGYLDEVRISKGIARWTADFSSNLPSSPY